MDNIDTNKITKEIVDSTAEIEKSFGGIKRLNEAVVYNKAVMKELDDLLSKLAGEVWGYEDNYLL